MGLVITQELSRRGTLGAIFVVVSMLSRTLGAVSVVVSMFPFVCVCVHPFFLLLEVPSKGYLFGSWIHL